MQDNQTKKEIIAQYKEREIIGGVCVITNTLNNKLLLGAAIDLCSIKNRFEFSQITGSCVDLKLQNDWNAQGGSQFSFEVLEELRKGETQTMEEFKADIALLKEIWAGELSDRYFY